jgi:putative hydrolase of HD superfamily
MKIEETIEKIMTSDKFVLSEVEKLRVLYVLKKEIRYELQRKEESHTESVAEHIYAIHCLIDYFLPIENPQGDWDELKIHQMAQYHDIDEIETGDIVGYKKTEKDYEAENEAAQIVINKLPDSLQGLVQNLMTEFDEQITIESKFVKALDKLESVLHMYDYDGKNFLHRIKYSRKDHQKYKKDYIEKFPSMDRFENVMAEVFEKEGFYYTES